MEACRSAGEARARFVRLVADGDHEIPLLVEVALEGLALVAGDVHAYLGHSLNREWAYGGGFGAGRA